MPSCLLTRKNFERHEDSKIKEDPHCHQSHKESVTVSHASRILMRFSPQPDPLSLQIDLQIKRENERVG